MATRKQWLGGIGAFIAIMLAIAALWQFGKVDEARFRASQHTKSGQ